MSTTETVVDIHASKPGIGPCETCHENAYVTIYLRTRPDRQPIATVSGCANCKTGPFSPDGPPAA